MSVLQKKKKRKKQELEGLPLLAHVTSVGVVGKPVVRTVLVKNLRKVAKVMKMPLPTQGVFEGAACGLFALFDGQSCAGEVGPQAAGYCAQQFHLKILAELSALAPERCFDNFVADAIKRSFRDLDEEVLKRAEGSEGCGACVALIIGQKLFTAVLGKCNMVLAEMTLKEGSLEPDGAPHPLVLGENPDAATPAVPAKLEVSAVGASGVPKAKGPPGAVKPAVGKPAVNRSLGDASFKASTSPHSIVTAIPKVHSIELDWGVQHPYLLMFSAPISESMEPKQIMDIAETFPVRPKAMSGEIATVAQAYAKKEKSWQCTVCALSFLPATQGEEKVTKGAPSVELPPSKKQKTAPKTDSMRLRHILVKHKECKNTRDLVRNKDVTRTKAEAETMLRNALKELRESGEDKVDPKKPEKTTPKFEKICKEISECQTALKGAGNRGDLGWMSKEQIKSMGTDFEEVVNALHLAKWSDITYSSEGCHLILRML